MMDLTGDTSATRAALDRLVKQLPRATSDAVERTLDDLIGQLQAATPIRSGLMEASYDVVAGAMIWELVNDAASPQGFEYPSRVAQEPGFSQAYDALNQILDSAEDQLTDAVDAALSALLP